ncbi:nucleotidyltransferase domain-containing protein [Phyllobacterium endophyticum]|uniref:Nucleotidyltransferase n=1 Tax=Phyllobacterium endophyticum TaxID=1149773 RepID=A0A2P7AK91_9HYPH|nr:nucleotidyltransferase [Phyllobacterium endophyticum]MBB3237150.1 hypothetical protein [Phyllobacterium endophyticum]PSH54626.1 nucleotidyltransferase [Phyllobacterium endophyticum]TYR40607.1 nucleotidyltransferase [Phyllobacterium endophyticum]
MNMSRIIGVDPFVNPIDRILAEIALSVQLPPSLHAKAIKRYEAVRNHLESTTSIFVDQIEHFYPQGSMAIDATISNRGTDDEYDIDIIAQLGSRFVSMTPLEILNELEQGLVGYRGLKVVRQTRCVTLYYEDSMHLDVTPSLRDPRTPDRQSRIMHAKGPHRSSDDREVPMNAYGFAQWYNDRTPDEAMVTDAFRKRWTDIDNMHADAEVDDVPDQSQFGVKSATTLALQLIKRFRNIRWLNRSGRMPPSIVLSYFAGKVAMPGSALSETLIALSTLIVSEIETATRAGRTLHVENPTYSSDVFTDRWPESIQQQDLFAKDLKELIAGLEMARRAQIAPEAIPDWLRGVFGDRVVTKVVDRMAGQIGQTILAGQQSYTRRGGILAPAATAAVAVAAPAILSPVQASRHTFYGDLPG